MIGKRDLLEVGCRLLGLYLGLEILLLPGAVVLAFSGDFSEGSPAFLIYILALYLAGLYFLFFKASKLAAWLLPEDGPLRLESREFRGRIADLGFRLLGAWYLVKYLPDTFSRIYTFLYHSIPAHAVTIDMWMRLFPALLNLGLGLLLLRYAHLLVRWLYGERAAADPPEQAPP